MGRYPQEARSAAVKCISCNAPVVPTVDGSYVCVECGESPIRSEDVTPDIVAVSDGDEHATGGEPSTGHEPSGNLAE